MFAAPSGRSERRSGPRFGALLASVVLHVGLAVAAWASGITSASALPPLKVYRVNIVSPPPAELGRPQPVPVNPPTVATTRPEPEPEPAPEPEPEPKPAPKPPPEPEPEPKVEAKPEPKVEAKPRPEPESKPAVTEEPKEPAATARGANPDPESTTSGEGLNVRIDGEVFPFPGYLENVVTQISRYFRWTGRSGLTAEIYFVILPDGSVDDIRLIRGSGDVAFNFEARAAIEQAGKRRAFGPLPEGFEGDGLPISFYFRPAR